MGGFSRPVFWRMIGPVNAILYPVAANAEQALSRPFGRAAREREAKAMAGEAVVFTTELVGPAFSDRDAALAAYRDRLETAALEERCCQLVERIVAEPGQAPRLTPVTPTFQDGRRWPTPPSAPPRTAWRLLISYWRPASAAEAEPPQARVVRRARAEVKAEDLRVLARSPLRPIKPQQPLDIGLFETRLPEAPHIIVPDE